MNPQPLQLVECPRDALQGWPVQVPTEVKIRYLNALLRVGFHTLDFGSFVSPKAIPQMADTAAVLKGLQLEGVSTRLLAIVANLRGAEEAAAHEVVSDLGFPFSLSPTFQQRNTNSSMEESLQRVEAIQKLCVQTGKRLVVYLSMGFGNPYGDAWDETVLHRWAGEMVGRGIEVLSLADTVGLAAPEVIARALETLIPEYPDTVFGVHLHSAPHNWQPKLAAAADAGCRRFDGALKGIGGCPLAGDTLIGNMDTEWILEYFRERGAAPLLNKEAFEESLRLAEEIFRSH